MTHMYILKHTHTCTFIYEIFSCGKQLNWVLNEMNVSWCWLVFYWTTDSILEKYEIIITKKVTGGFMMFEDWAYIIFTGTEEGII